MSRRRIKDKKANQHKAKFKNLNIPIELWASYVDFLWGSILNTDPETLNPSCAALVKNQVMKAIDEGSVKVENNKIKVK